MKSRFPRLVVCCLVLAFAPAAIATAAQIECTGNYQQIRCADGALLSCSAPEGYQVDCPPAPGYLLAQVCQATGHQGFPATPLPQLVPITPSTRAVLCPGGTLVESFSAPPVHLLNVCQIADTSHLIDSVFSQGQLDAVCRSAGDPFYLPTLSDLGLVLLGTAIAGLGLFRLRRRAAPGTR